MPSAQELTYQGNAGLAGGTSGNNAVYGVIENSRTIDAVDKFTAYSMQLNRDKWVQANIEIQRQAQEAAKNLSVSYGNLIPEDRGVVDESVKEMYDIYRSNPTSVKYTVDPKTGKNNAEDYNKFLAAKSKMDHAIVRGNLRAEQLIKMEDELAKITDPQRAAEMRKAILEERKKPITENLVLPPNITPFNLSKAASDWAVNGARGYEFIQRFPNDVLTVTKDLFDPFAASQQPVSQLYAPGNEDMKQTIAGAQDIMNRILKKHIRDQNGTPVLDMEALRMDVDAKPLLEQVDIFNQHVKNMNTRETIESGQTTKKKVREFLGYTEDLPEIDLRDGVSATDVIRMAMTYKMGMKTQMKYQNTNQELTRYNIDVDAASRAADRRQRDKEFWAEYNKGDKEQAAIADEKIGLFYNTMNTPVAGGTFVKKNEEGKQIGGWEVGLTAPLVEALKIPSDKTVTTKKDKTPDESMISSATDESTTATTTTAIYPKHVYVIRPANINNENKQSLQVHYDDGTIREFSSLQFFNTLNNMHGNDAKVRAAVSAASIKRLREMGLVQPDLKKLKETFGNIPQSSGVHPNTMGGTAPTSQTTTVPAATNSQGRKPKPY